MKLVPFLISTIAAAVALVMAILNYTNASSNLKQQDDLQKKQQEIQELREVVEAKQREYQTQQQVIDQGATVMQKYGQAIYRDIGVISARNKNDKLKMLLVRQKLEGFIPNEEQLKQIEEQIKKAQSQQQGGTGTTPATPR